MASACTTGRGSFCRMAHAHKKEDRAGNKQGFSVIFKHLNEKFYFILHMLLEVEFTYKYFRVSLSVL